MDLKFESKKEAIKVARRLSKENDYVTVIESRNDFYIEFTPPLIRHWEKQVFTKDKIEL